LMINNGYYVSINFQIQKTFNAMILQGDDTPFNPIDS